MRRIHSDFPNAKIIQLVRNPVDILASRKKSDPSFNLRNVLIHIRKSFKISKQKLKLNDPAHILIRYEALCQFPESNVRLLCQLIDIGISETLLTPSIAGLPATANSSFEKKSASGQIHRWDRTHEDVILTGLEKNSFPHVSVMCQRNSIII